MKITNLIKLLFVSSFISASVFSQDCLKCKIQLQPSNKYSTSMTTESKSVVEYEASKEVIDKLVSNGYTNPTAIETIQQVSTNTNTGQSNFMGSFPVVFEIKQMKTIQKRNGEVVSNQTSPISGIRAAGVCNQEGKTSIDSVYGDQLDDEMKQSILQIFTSMLDISSLPPNCLKIGDSFTDEKPLEIPMSGFEPIKMKIETKYTLTKRDGRLAYLKLEQKISLRNSSEKTELRAHGAGDGMMILDVDKNYITSNAMKIELSMKLIAGPISIKLTQSSNVDMSVEFGDN